MLRRGIVIKLDSGQVKFWSVNENGDIPADVFGTLAKHTEAIRYYLEECQRFVAKATAIWWEHDTGGYREECRRYWEEENNQTFLKQ